MIQLFGEVSIFLSNYRKFSQPKVLLELSIGDGHTSVVLCTPMLEKDRIVLD